MCVYIYTHTYISAMHIIKAFLTVGSQSKHLKATILCHENFFNNIAGVAVQIPTEPLSVLITRH